MTSAAWIELTFDSDELARLDRCDARKASGHERQQVFQSVRLRAENEDCDLSASQILLAFKTLIHGEENVEFGSFRGLEELAIF